MTKLAVSKAREDLAEMLNRVAYAHERLVIERRGKNLAALIPMEDLELLELLEDKIDVAAARKAIADAKANGEQPLAWKDVKKKLGL
jgi:prevent-host-death family protein